jgi:predicted S18 family serine protease
MIPVSGYLFFQNTQFREQVADLTISFNEFASLTVILEQQLNMSESQLDYYKELALYYSDLKPINGENGFVIGSSSIPIVAVQTIQSGFQVEYKGAVMEVDIELRKGTGRILVGTVPIIGIDIQTSVRTAVLVAEEVTGMSLTNTDLILTVRSDEEVEIVDGQSAGAAITMALISAMTNKEVNQDIYMTGTINGDLSVGAVSSIPYKAIAAAEKGSLYFVVPEGQNTVEIYKPVSYKTIRGRIITTYDTETVELENYLSENGYSVQVLEVKDINEAYTIFFN